MFAGEVRRRLPCALVVFAPPVSGAESQTGEPVRASGVDGAQAGGEGLAQELTNPVANLASRAASRPSTKVRVRQ
jgi:hypothetical protein